jgi:hypothetical protein
MMGWLFFVNPVAYAVLERAAAVRHEMFSSVFGTHADDIAMRAVYPIPTSFLRFLDPVER